MISREPLRRITTYPLKADQCICRKASGRVNYRGRQLRLRDPKTGRLYRVIGFVPRLAPPPKAVRNAKLDNIALVPASLLPLKEQWQHIAHTLPKDELLVIVPSTDRAPRKILEAVTALLKAKGHRVTTLPAERFS